MRDVKVGYVLLPKITKFGDKYQNGRGFGA
jgi:hypothetical protein